MIRNLILIIFFSSCAIIEGQSALAGYKILPGEIYYLKMDLSQQTQSESKQLSGDVSLDISFKIEFLLTDISPEENYFFNCRYSGLHVSFFSPQSDIAISSQNNAFRPLKDYLSELESRPFRLVMSKYGETLSISGLDSTINSFYQDKKFTTSEHEMFLKTIQEAFGQEALKSFTNIALNIYNPQSNQKIIKHSYILFNAKSVPITNTFYYLPAKDSSLRVQGIGIIDPAEDSLKLASMSVVTLMKGNQTYDYLFNEKTGWIIEGLSKQKIQSLSIIKGHQNLPDGLKVPSYTDSEYQFSGGQFIEN